MREVLSISLREQTAEEIKQKAKDKGFLSVSSYISFLIEQDNDLISENELLERSKKSSSKYNKNKLHKLKSVGDLMK